MNRSELEHGIRAACDVAGVRDIIVIGSQAILGQYPDAPRTLRVSREMDVYPPTRPDHSDLIDGALGELSEFDTTHGFYVHGVGPETATLPNDWESRLIAVRNENTRNHTGWCLEVHDLAASKLVAGRPKDNEFVRELLKHRLIRTTTLRERIRALPLPAHETERIAERLPRLQPESRPGPDTPSRRDRGR